MTCNRKLANRSLMILKAIIPHKLSALARHPLSFDLKSERPHTYMPACLPAYPCTYHSYIMYVRTIDPVRPLTGLCSLCIRNTRFKLPSMSKRRLHSNRVRFRALNPASSTHPLSHYSLLPFTPSVHLQGNVPLTLRFQRLVITGPMGMHGKSAINQSSKAGRQTIQIEADKHTSSPPPHHVHGLSGN